MEGSIWTTELIKWLANLIILYSTYLLGRKNPLGWLLGVIAGTYGIFYMVLIDEIPFAAATGVMVIVRIWGFFQWKKNGGENKYRIEMEDFSIEKMELEITGDGRLDMHIEAIGRQTFPPEVEMKKNLKEKVSESPTIPAEGHIYTAGKFCFVFGRGYVKPGKINCDECPWKEVCTKRVE